MPPAAAERCEASFACVLVFSWLFADRGGHGLTRAPLQLHPPAFFLSFVSSDSSF